MPTPAQYQVTGANGFAFRADLTTIAKILQLQKPAVDRIVSQAAYGPVTLHFNGRPPIAGIGDQVTVEMP